MEFSKFLQRGFLIFFIFHFSLAGLFAQENQKTIIENQLYPSFLFDQFIEEKLSILAQKPKNGLNEHFIKSISKFKSKGFKNLFVDYVFHKFSLEEIQKLDSFYKMRRDYFQKQLSPEMQKKFAELSTDLSLLLANVPDDDETGLNSISYPNEIKTGASFPTTNIAQVSSEPADNPGSASAIMTSSPTSTLDLKRFSLGEFVSPSKDEELHYIKIEVEIGYDGPNVEFLEKNKNEMRDAVNSILMKLSVQRAKEDYIDHFLHNDIQKKIQEILDRIAPGKIRILRILIPVFLIN